MIPLTVCTAVFALAALVLAALGPRTGLWGGLCAVLAAAGALILGLDEKALLAGALVLLCVSRAGKRWAHEL